MSIQRSRFSSSFVDLSMLSESARLPSQVWCPFLLRWWDSLLFINNNCILYIPVVRHLPVVQHLPVVPHLIVVQHLAVVQHLPVVQHLLVVLHLIYTYIHIPWTINPTKWTFNYHITLVNLLAYRKCGSWVLDWSIASMMIEDMHLDFSLLSVHVCSIL